MNSKPMPDTEARIWERLLEPATGVMAPEVACFLSGLDFGQPDKQCMDELALKVREGKATPQEQAELEAFGRVGQLLELVRSKARKALPVRVSSGPVPEAHSAALAVPAGIRRSQEAFYRDLPRLLPLKSRQCQWVAYHREERVGFGRTETELYQECFRRGFSDDEFYVGRIEPHALAPWVEEEIDPSCYEFGQAEPGKPFAKAGSL
jgi:hypothetical protein